MGFRSCNPANSISHTFLHRPYFNAPANTNEKFHLPQKSFRKKTRPRQKRHSDLLTPHISPRQLLFRGFTIFLILTQNNLDKKKAFSTGEMLLILIETVVLLETLCQILFLRQDFKEQRLLNASMQFRFQRNFLQTLCVKTLKMRLITNLLSTLLKLSRIKACSPYPKINQSKIYPQN